MLQLRCARGGYWLALARPPHHLNQNQKTAGRPECGNYGWYWAAHCCSHHPNKFPHQCNRQMACVKPQRTHAVYRWARSTSKCCLHLTYDNECGQASVVIRQYPAGSPPPCVQVWWPYCFFSSSSDSSQPSWFPGKYIRQTSSVETSWWAHFVCIQKNTLHDDC